MPDANAIRILIADDHPVVRDGLAAMLGTQPDFEVVATAANGPEAVRLAAELKPDVVLLDLEMPELDGVEALARMRAASPAVRALVFTAFDTDERILGAVRAGAQGYLLKGAPRDELFRAVRVISQGGSLLQPVVASKLLQRMANRAGAEPAVTTTALTGREAQVLGLLAQAEPIRKLPPSWSSASARSNFMSAQFSASWGLLTGPRRCAWRSSAAWWLCESLYDCPGRQPDPSSVALGLKAAKL
jgi:DNA-binding NarL/FixJ family response regulator